MRKLFALFLCILLMIMLFPMPASAAPPTELSSDTAVLMDADTGQVLYDKGMHKRVYPASTTKILTALLVLENAKPYEVMTVSDTALDDIGWDSSHIALTPGEQLTVEDGLYALMLPSANDAANVLAEHVAGSKEAFARMMTERAHEIGAVESNFRNAHGLHDDNHYTTAYDMALLTRYAMNNPEFMVYFGTARHTMPATNLNIERDFTNYQYMLVAETDFYNPDVIGGKVGFTTEAGNTMSTVARRNGRTLICTVMHSATRNQKFDDTEKLLAFGFDEFVPFTLSAEEFGQLIVPVTENGDRIGQVYFETEESFSALIHNSVNRSDVAVKYTAPESYGRNDDVSCEVRFEVGGGPGYVPAVLGSIPMNFDIIIPTIYTMNIPAPGGEAPAGNMLTRILTGVGIAAGAIVLILIVMALYQRRKMLKRRRQRRERLERIRREAALYTSAAYKPPVMRAVGHNPGRRNVYEYPAKPGTTQRKAR